MGYPFLVGRRTLQHLIKIIIITISFSHSADIPYIAPREKFHTLPRGRTTDTYINNPAIFTLQILYYMTKNSKKKKFLIREHVLYNRKQIVLHCHCLLNLLESDLPFLINQWETVEYICQHFNGNKYESNPQVLLANDQMVLHRN